jgi:hypothetical protein
MSRRSAAGAKADNHSDISPRKINHLRALDIEWLEHQHAEQGSRGACGEVLNGTGAA